MNGESTRVPEVYSRTLTASAQQKLKALALLAEGGDDATWRAVVLLHEARRAERRALLVLEAPSPETRLRSVVEQCGCLIDGRDPTAILDGAWGEVLEAAELVAPPVSAAIRRRLDPRVDELIREYAAATRGMAEFSRVVKGDGSDDEALVRRALHQAEQLLERFPGDSRNWWGVAMLRQQLRLKGAAWEAIRRSRALDPEDNFARGIELYLVPEALPPDQARATLHAAHLAAMHGATDLDVCIPLALSLVSVAKQAPDPRSWWEKALDVATVGLGLPPLDPNDHKLCRVVQLATRELLAGRRPTVDIWFRVGLGTLVPRLSPEEREDIVRAMQTLGRPARALRLAA